MTQLVWLMLHFRLLNLPSQHRNPQIISLTNRLLSTDIDLNLSHQVYFSVPTITPGIPSSSSTNHQSGSEHALDCWIVLVDLADMALVSYENDNFSYSSSLSEQLSQLIISSHASVPTVPIFLVCVNKSEWSRLANSLSSAMTGKSLVVSEGEVEQCVRENRAKKLCDYWIVDGDGGDEDAELEGVLNEIIGMCERDGKKCSDKGKEEWICSVQ